MPVTFYSSSQILAVFEPQQQDWLFSVVGMFFLREALRELEAELFSASMDSMFWGLFYIFIMHCQRCLTGKK